MTAEMVVGDSEVSIEKHVGDIFASMTSEALSVEVSRG